MFTSAAKQKSVTPDTGNSPDNLLRAIIDACVSNVAVLDESGSIIYASKAWNLLEHSREPIADLHDNALADFESFGRFSESGLDKQPTVTLSDDLQEIL